MTWISVRFSRPTFSYVKCLTLVCRGYGKKAGKMVKILNVAEKNDAAKSLAEIMSGGHFRRREGISKFNKIYEYEYNILNQNATMVMTSVSGHLLTHEFVGQYKKWYGCSATALFDAPMQKHCPDRYVDIKRTLEREIRGCQSLIIWTDGDREGENIGMEIVDVCKAVKPGVRVYRARFSEITRQAVAQACRNLKPPDQNVSDAVDIRSELDLRIGAAFTRFQTQRLQKVFPEALSERLISYGSCQFPTLGFVVERYKQVQAFIPEPFWKIKVSHETEDGLVDFTWKRDMWKVKLPKKLVDYLYLPQKVAHVIKGRLFEHLPCLVLYQHVTEEPLAKVIEVKSKSKSKWRPQALDTVEMEKLSSRKLRINAKETMQIAEKLYTKGFISYPRTETNMFAKDIDLASLVRMQTQDQQWGGFAGRILEEGGPTPRNGKKTDNAHPPIHPIKYTDTLQGNEKKVYEFIVRHFLACCYKDAQGQETTVEIDINQERFTASGLMIIARNYLDVYPYEKWNARVIPRFQQNETFTPTSIAMSEGETSPPPLLTEADLIALMDKHGIGTDATHAEHIETVKSRMYVGVRDDGKIVPGELGMGLVDGYDSMGFEMSKPHLRSELEADLQRICDGVKDKNVVLEEQIQKYKQVFIAAVQQAEKIDAALSEYFGNAQAFTEPAIQQHAVVRPCPLCRQDMVLKTRKEGKGHFLSCMGYPNCRAAIWFPDFVLEAAMDEAVCDTCQPSPVHLIKFKFKRGSVPPTIPTEYVGCIGGCDEMLTEVLDLRPFRPTQAAAGRNNSVNRGGQTSTQRSANDSGYGSSFNSNRSTQSQNTTPHTPTNRNNNQNNRGGGGGGSNTPGYLGRGRGRGGSAGRGGGPGRGGGGERSVATAAVFRSPQAQSIGPQAGEGDSNAIVCNCGQDALMLTVRKEGPNTGRQFYKCHQPQGSGCTFFLWADQPPPEPSTGQGGNNSTNNSFNSSYNQSSSFNNQQNTGNDDTQCGCGQAAKFLTVHKEGPNKGRQFYACPTRGEGCNFFQWADEPPGERSFNRGGGRGRGRGGGGGRGRGRGGGGGASGEGGTTRKRKCGLCGEEGHTKRTCPHNG